LRKVFSGKPLETLKSHSTSWQEREKRLKEKLRNVPSDFHGVVVAVVVAVSAAVVVVVAVYHKPVFPCAHPLALGWGRRIPAQCSMICLDSAVEKIIFWRS
jgi:hypothetical protein